MNLEQKALEIVRNITNINFSGENEEKLLELCAQDIVELCRQLCRNQKEACADVVWQSLKDYSNMEYNAPDPDTYYEEVLNTKNVYNEKI